MSMRFSLRVLQIGLVAVVLAVTTHKIFELDRFLVPKELVLHAAAFLAALFAWRGMRSVRMTVVDALLASYVVLSAISAALATNRWLGLRALAVTASAALLFWIARGLREAGLARPLLNALAFAVVLAAVTSLLQAYGVRIELFSLNRAPGGTLGNRNFVGHAAAFGLPLVALAAIRGSRLAYFGVAIVTASLVLTRSRAAWIAAAAAILLVVAAFIAARTLRPMFGRVVIVLLFGVAGAAAAMFIPNTLRWRSDNPYLESVKSVADYAEGSGRGRLVHYQRSLVMAAAHPLFGVGPGNWPVVYPKFAARNDPSLNDGEAGMTFNPWPSSDWIALVAERGLFAFLAIALVFAALAWSAVRRVFDVDVEEALSGVLALATLAGAALAGAFDAVLLLALPAMIVWLAVGAAGLPAPLEARALKPAALLFAIVLAGLGAVRSGMQLAAMDLFSRGQVQTAASVDPGNFRAQLRLARSGKRKQRCEHARAAHALFPTSAAARNLARDCGE